MGHLESRKQKGERPLKTLNRVLTAVFFALCLGMTALADLLPIPPEPEPEPKQAGPLVPILIVAVAVIAAAVLTVVLRRRRR